MGADLEARAAKYAERLDWLGDARSFPPTLKYRYNPPEEPHNLLSEAKYWIYKNPLIASLVPTLTIAFEEGLTPPYLPVAELSTAEGVLQEIIIRAALPFSCLGLSYLSLRLARNHDYFKHYLKKPKSTAARVWNAAFEHPALLGIATSAGVYTNFLLMAYAERDPSVLNIPLQQASSISLSFLAGLASYSAITILSNVLHTNNIKKLWHKAIAHFAENYGKLEPALRHSEAALELETSLKSKIVGLTNVGRLNLKSGNLEASLQAYGSAFETGEPYLE